MKYKFKGTQGSWYAGENFDGDPAVILRQQGWSVGTIFIVEEFQQEDTAQADANAIAAVPEMIEALIEFHSVFDMLPCLCKSNFICSPCKARSAADIALNKALKF